MQGPGEMNHVLSKGQLYVLFNDKNCRNDACGHDATKNIVITFHWKVMHVRHVTVIYVTAQKASRGAIQRDGINWLC